MENSNDQLTNGASHFSMGASIVLFVAWPISITDEGVALTASGKHF